MNAETVPTRFAKSLLNLVIERGYDYAGMLNVAGISFDPQQTESADYQDSITAMQYSKLYQQVLSLLAMLSLLALANGEVISGELNTMESWKFVGRFCFNNLMCNVTRAR